MSGAKAERCSVLLQGPRGGKSLPNQLSLVNSDGFVSRENCKVQNCCAYWDWSKPAPLMPVSGEAQGKLEQEGHQLHRLQVSCFPSDPATTLCSPRLQDPAKAEQTPAHLFGHRRG